jgi:SpoVK/Ycf46/Vps4 family AAA+-type ATPase
MSVPEQCQKALPYPHLLSRRDIALLWHLRIATEYGPMLCDHDRVVVAHWAVRELDLPERTPSPGDADNAVFPRLIATLEQMEPCSSDFHYCGDLRANMALLEAGLGLCRAESRLLALAALLSTREMIELNHIGCSECNVPRHLARIIDEPEPLIADAISPRGVLRRAGLVAAPSGNRLKDHLSLARGSYRKIAARRLNGLEDLLDGFIHACPAPSLRMADYRHTTQGALALEIIREALDHQRVGVNILLYGAPGTGKTQLAHVIAKTTGADAYAISPTDEDGSAEDATELMGEMAIAQTILRDRRVMLLFDECDGVFTAAQFGHRSKAELVKGWANDMLETNPVPSIWIANAIDRIDSAFVRRFDLVARLDTLPASQRLRLLSRLCEEQVSASQLKRIASVDALTPAVLQRAAAVMSRIDGTGKNPDDMLETILDGTLQAQGHVRIRRACRNMPPDGYDASLCNASMDMDELAAGLRRAGQGRVLLYGPPGTGKTAFGQWLAQALDRPLALRRVSDIQSPWLGVMERRLADVFDRAIVDEAVLQLDEVDSFLRDRHEARQHWEVSQINEFLAQLEAFHGILVATTNRMEGLDRAALRRFDYKVKLDYLSAEQAWSFFRRKLSQWQLPMPDPERCRQRLANVDNLAPGDFAVAAQRQAINPCKDAQALIDLLAEEVTFKSPVKHLPMGFT